MTAIAALMLLQPPAIAGPEGGTVVAGQAAISQAGTATNINQSTNKAIINWQGFSVGANESVNFYQPGASSVTLNRVIGNESSVINGALNANGQVFIVNSAGVLFGKGAQINVGGLVASTLDISNSDFMAGNYTFSGTSNAAVINQGRIRANGGGYVALLGKTVLNEGVISARLGTVAMSSGEKITLNFEGNSLLDVTIDKGVLNALVENKRLIKADGGTVIMTAKAADQLLSAQVNNTGIVQARTVAALKGGSATGGVKIGKIKLIAEGGTTNVSGKLDASAPRGGDGGFIETSGDKVKIADSAMITTLAPYGITGTWLIDPIDFTIAASGGDISGATLSSLLNTTSQGFSATNNLYVNDAISWSANTTLTLTAGNNLYVNKAVTASGDNAALNLTATTGTIYINNAVTLSGAHTALTMTYGTDYNIRTKASYAGAVLDADGKPVANTDTSGGVYGSITFTNSANTNGLKINGNTYTLIYDMAGLALNTRTMNGTVYYYNPLTGQYDLTAATVLATQSVPIQSTNLARKNLYSGSLGADNIMYWNTATQAYDIPYSKTGGACGSATCYYSPETGTYSLTSVYSLSSPFRYYFQDTSGNFTIAQYNGVKFYDPYNGLYDSTSSLTSLSYYKDSNGNYTIPISNGTSYYDPLAQTYTLQYQYSGSMVYNRATGAYDIYSLNAATGKYYDLTTGAYTSSTSSLSLTATGYYAIANNLDASGTTYSTALLTAFGDSGGTMPSVLTGLGHTIDKLTISASTANVGLIGSANRGVVLRDIGLTNVNISSTKNNVGALVGQGSATIYNAYSTGTVTGNNYVGGLAGSAANIEYAYSSANVTGVQGIGGLAGSVSGSSDPNAVPHGSGWNISSTVAHAYATGKVTATGGGGGLIGNATDTTLNLVYATGDVSGSGQLGGLLGGFSMSDSIFNPTLTNAFSTGNVSGGGTLGGLIGGMGPGSYSSVNLVGKTISVDNVYTTGNVTSTNGGIVGGLIGQISNGDWNIGTYPNAPSFSISNAHASGNVTLSSAPVYYDGAYIPAAGGLVGEIIGSRYSAASGGADTGAGLAGTITNSSATGKVDASGMPGTIPVQTGGLVGYSQQTSYSGVSATGNVVGGSASVGNSGGLFGFVQTGAISNSYANNTVTGGGRTGGIAGLGSSNVSVSSTYYNGSNSSSSFGLLQSNRNNSDNSRGLSGQQIKDIAFYANGTIGQVLADRSFRAEGVRTGSTVATGSDVSSSAAPPTTASSIAAMQQAEKSGGVDDGLKQVEQSIKAEDRQHDRDRQRRASARRGAGSTNSGGGSGAGYGATIRSIDVDGQRFDLENNSAPGSNNNNNSGAPAPGGAAR